MTISLGVDPGLTGAAGLVCSTRGLLACADLPTVANGIETGSMKRWIDADALDRMFKEWAAQYDFARESVCTVLERPIPMPTLPAQTIAAQFDTFGVVRSLLVSKTWGRGLRYVNPREWKSRFGLKTDKDASRACCLRLYPTAPVKLKKQHNVAEAILLAHVGLMSLS